MPALGKHEVVRLVKQVDIGPVLPLVRGLPFVSVGQSKPEQYKCDVVLPAHFPSQLRELIDGLALGGELGRAVIRRLSPHQSIPPHVDDWMPAEADWRRFQVPLVSDPSVVMRWPDDGVEMHLAPGNLYEVRFDRTHEVVNDWDGERVHLQVDQVNATI